MDKEKLKQIKIVSFDLDHTLLSDSHTLSDYAVDTCRKLLKQGYYVIISTGRPHFNTDWVLEKIGKDHPNLFQVSLNGAFIKDVSKDHLLYQNFIDPKILKEVYVFLEQNKFKTNVYTDVDIIGSKKTFLTKWLTKVSKRDVLIKPYTDFPTKNISKIVSYLERVIFISKKLDKLESSWAEKLEFFRSTWGGFEICSKGISKSFGVEYIAKKIGLTLNNVMSFGDSGNDVCMLSNSGIGVAMSNGTSAAVKSADYTTRYTHLRDGAARFAAEHLLDEKDY